MFPNTISNASKKNPKPYITPFLAKTYEILMKNDYEEIVCWCHDGQGFIVRDIVKFETIILPKYFKHNKFSSFTRQLNMYDFHKLRHKSHQKEFRHVFFARGKPELLSQIKRKTPEQVEANDKKLKETFHMADNWRKLQGQLEGFQTQDEVLPLVQEIMENQPSTTAELGNLFQEKSQDSNGFSVNETTSNLMICLVLFNKALKNETEKVDCKTSGLIMKHTEDYINSIKTVIELKKNSSPDSTQASENHTNCLNKRSFGDMNDINDDIFDYAPEKKVKDSDFPISEYQAKVETKNCQLNFGSEDAMSANSYQELDDFYKLSTLEDFKMTLHEVHHSQLFGDLW